MAKKKDSVAPEELPMGDGLLDRARRAIMGRKLDQDKRIKQIMGDNPTPDYTSNPEYRSKESK